MSAKGPLAGVRVLEFAGLGPAPFCGMLLSDLGADVLRIDRQNEPQFRRKFQTVTGRGRRSITLDLKDGRAIDVALKLAARSELLIEGFRPGVMERLGLGPAVVLERNPRIVYGRMTGWGQHGPYAQSAGHDINYVAICGALHAIGSIEKPHVPLNLLGDFGGGALYLAFGLLAALLHSRTTGAGQVVDCAITDGAASLMAMIYGLQASGEWNDSRESNLLDGGAPFYTTYKCADGKWLSIGALEPEFYAFLVDKIGLSDVSLQAQNDCSSWPVQRERFGELFQRRTRDQWCRILEQTDACFAPVLSLQEAPLHAHNAARQTFVRIDDVVQPAPAPRFSLTPGEIQGPNCESGQHNATALQSWGLSDREARELQSAGVLQVPTQI